MENLSRFQGQVVVINGASRGIGRGIALRFAREGANLVVSANEEQVHDVAEEIKAMGAEALAVICDVTNKEAVTDLYAQTIQTFGQVDVSIQNAGVITIAKLEDLTEAAVLLDAIEGKKAGAFFDLLLAEPGRLHSGTAPRPFSERVQCLQGNTRHRRIS